jgi:hypothetical protein
MFIIQSINTNLINIGMMEMHMHEIYLFIWDSNNFVYPFRGSQ